MVNLYFENGVPEISASVNVINYWFSFGVLNFMRFTQFLDEIRYSGAELHCTSSILAGVASQEVVKIVTRQFTPLNNTFIYNNTYKHSDNSNILANSFNW